MTDTTDTHVLGRPQGADWHRTGVGGMWDEIGALQFNFLVSQGLETGHLLLDIGCGSLRGGVRFIQYLEPGHYYGIDKEESLLEAGREIELERSGLTHKSAHLYLIDDFDLSNIPDVRFDFMLAQSVFTHLRPEAIELCLKNVMCRLNSAGAFYATIFESLDGRNHPGPAHPWRVNETKASCYPITLFQRMAAARGVTLEYIGDWNHPRGQKMLRFTR